MLVGREQERRVLDALVVAARVGRSGTLVLSGEAGIGKTTLLDDAADRAARARMPVLRATGVAAEREVPFGGLLQLLRPVLPALASLPAPQADALGSALALTPGSGAERFAVGAATLSLLSRAAEDAPLLCVLDDAHLLDVPSAQALCFAARRLSADPVALVFAVRADVPCVVADADLPALLVGGLSDAEAAELVGAGAGDGVGSLAGVGGESRAGPVPDALAARLRSVTGGNPLALLELAHDLGALDLLPPGAPVPVPQSLARAFGQRAEGLSPAARTALLVAASGVDDLGVVARACAHLGVDVGALDEAESARLLVVDAGRVVFRHGLVRSGVYARATPAQRRAVHGALAAALPEGDVDRRAWHLGEGARGPDAEVAAVVAEAATRAARRGAHAVASAGLQRAAALATTPLLEAGHLVAAAESAWRAGSADLALDLLARATTRPAGGDLAVRAAALEATIAVRTGSPAQAHAALGAAAAQVAGRDPDRAVLLLAEAVVAAQTVGDVAAARRAAAAIEVLEPRLSPRSRWVALVATGVAAVVAGEGADRLRRAGALAHADPALLVDPPLAPWVVLGSLYLREGGSREQVAAVMAHVRSRTDIGMLPSLLFYVGRDQATTDRWDDAVASYSEGAHLAREAGQATDVASCLAGLAWVQARRGREEDCRAHAEEALALARDRRLEFWGVWAMTALAELDLGCGRAQPALARLREIDAVLTRLGFDDVDISPGPELVEALLRVGAPEEAFEEAQCYAVRADAKGQPWARARAARALGLVAPDDELDERFGEALGHHARTLDGFETARTRLAYGARLRRARRRVDARPVLRDALATLDGLGAAPWADLAAAELRATGETAHRRGVPGDEQLTPQERQVARILADGATTREAAAALFLSPKTVEYHLRNVYVKLGVRSRTELTAALPEGS